MARSNLQSRQRRRAGQRLKSIIDEFGLTTREIAEATGIDRVTLDNLMKFTPQLSTIERLAKYLEAEARKRAAAKNPHPSGSCGPSAAARTSLASGSLGDST